MRFALEWATLGMANVYGPPGWTLNHSRMTSFRTGESDTRRTVCCVFDRFRSRMTTDSSSKSARRDRINSERRAPVWAAMTTIG